VKRLLGIDLGERRIGLAVADGDGGRAIAIATIRRGTTPAGDAAALQEIVRERDIGELVVGLPLEASGEEGSQARLTRAWIESVQPRIGLPVTLRDERLTSYLAEQRVGPMKRGRSGGPPSASQRQAYRARIDREAAAIILQDELDARATGATPREPPATNASPRTETTG
jgi:putative holliday junction resolvase